MNNQAVTASSLLVVSLRKCDIVTSDLLQQHALLLPLLADVNTIAIILERCWWYQRSETFSGGSNTNCKAPWIFHHHHLQLTEQNVFWCFCFVSYFTVVVENDACPGGNMQVQCWLLVSVQSFYLVHTVYVPFFQRKCCFIVILTVRWKLDCFVQVVVFTPLRCSMHFTFFIHVSCLNLKHQSGVSLYFSIINKSQLTCRAEPTTCGSVFQYCLTFTTVY